jgi:hypothetical protein
MGFFQNPGGWFQDEFDKLGRGLRYTFAGSKDSEDQYKYKTFAETPQGQRDAITEAERLAQKAATEAAEKESRLAESRADLSAFIQGLKDRASGTGGPSLAQGQLQRATDSNLRQAVAAGQSQRGVGHQAALKSILENRARAQQEAAGQSSLLRNQESIQAEQMLGNAIAQQRSGDIDVNRLRTQDRQFQQQMLQQQIDRKRAADNQMTGALLQTGGAVLGTMFGGPAGGAAGSAAGGALANTISPGARVADVAPPQDYSDDMLSYEPMAHGGQVPTDSIQRDTVPAMLSPGEIVLPRSVAQSEDAPDRAAEFVAAIKAQKSGGAKDAALRSILERMYRGGVVC